MNPHHKKGWINYLIVALCVGIMLIHAAVWAQQWFSPNSIPTYVGTSTQEQVLIKQHQMAGCANNLKQLLHALYLYSGDYNDRYPTSWSNLAVYITNNAALTCPSAPLQPFDTNFNPALITYNLTNTVYWGSRIPVIECPVHHSRISYGGLVVFPKNYTSFPLQSNATPYLPTPEIAAGQKKASLIQCRNNLFLLMINCKVYTGDNGDKFPTNISLYTSYLDTPETLYCPSAKHTYTPTNFNDVVWSNIDYTLHTNLSWDLPDDTPVITCKIHEDSACLLGNELKFSHSNSWNYPNLIQGHPISQTVFFDTKATLKIQCRTNLYHPTYQWFTQQPFDSNGDPFTNSIPIAGATNATFEIPHCSSANEGYYNVLVSTADGESEISSMAYLAVREKSTVSMNSELQLLCCSNNLRKILFASIIVDNFQTVHENNEALQCTLGWPMTLFCPSDTNNPPPELWNEVDWKQISYRIDYSKTDATSTNILAFCKIHHNFIRGDGSYGIVPPLTLSQPQCLSDGVILKWNGGLPPYSVESTTSLTSPDWKPQATNLWTNECPINTSTNTAFYRVVSSLK
jgi:hypothetical protein